MWVFIALYMRVIYGRIKIWACCQAPTPPWFHVTAWSCCDCQGKARTSPEYWNRIVLEPFRCSLGLNSLLANLFSFLAVRGKHLKFFPLAGMIVLQMSTT